MVDYNKLSLQLCFGLEEEFQALRQLHKVAMIDAVVKSIGEWNDELQHKRLLKNFEKSFKSLTFIEYENKIIGSINVREELFEDEGRAFHYVEHFYLYPEFQKYGIGSWLLQNHVPRVSRLSYLKHDEKASRFYAKNGFEVYTQDDYQNYAQRT